MRMKTVELFALNVAARKAAAPVAVVGKAAAPVGAAAIIIMITIIIVIVMRLLSWPLPWLPLPLISCLV